MKGLNMALRKKMDVIVPNSAAIKRVEERRQVLLTFLKCFLELPRLKQHEKIQELIKKLLEFPIDHLSRDESLAVEQTYSLLMQLNDPRKDQHLLQIPERVNWIIAEMTRTGPLKSYRSLFIENDDGNFPRSVQIYHDFKHQIGIESENLIPNLQDP